MLGELVRGSSRLIDFDNFLKNPVIEIACCRTGFIFSLCILGDLVEGPLLNT